MITIITSLALENKRTDALERCLRVDRCRTDTTERQPAEKKAKLIVETRSLERFALLMPLHWRATTVVTTTMSLTTHRGTSYHHDAQFHESSALVGRRSGGGCLSRDMMYRTGVLQATHFDAAIPQLDNITAIAIGISSSGGGGGNRDKGIMSTATSTSMLESAIQCILRQQHI